MLKCGDQAFEIGKRTYVMGILNVTPDSFSDGGKFNGVDSAVAHAEKMLEEGADIIDVGGESTRPFADKVSQREELGRVLPVIEALANKGITNISIDTRNAQTAKICLEAGASWLNDVSALSHDEHMVAAVRNADAVILMHARGTPDVMQVGNICYDNPVEDVKKYLEDRIAFAKTHGVDPSKIIVDPGIGFGKRLPHNLELIRRLDVFKDCGAAVLCGTSRKSFLGELTGIEDASQRASASVASACYVALKGADIVRVHDVRATVEALKVIDVLRE